MKVVKKVIDNLHYLFHLASPTICKHICLIIPQNTGATNQSGFSALPGGLRGSNGEFGSVGYCSFFGLQQRGMTRMLGIGDYMTTLKMTLKGVSLKLMVCPLDVSKTNEKYIKRLPIRGHKKLEYWKFLGVLVILF